MTLFKYAVALVLLATMLVPLVAMAQTATTSPYYYGGWGYYDYSSDSATTSQQRVRGIRQQSSAMQQQIAGLGGVAATSLSIPVLFGVALNNISPNFGDPRDNGTRTHLGEDIMAVKGTPVVSPTVAVVLHVTTGVSEGNTVYTANPGGETFVYMHLDHFGEGVTEGTVLQPGALIGYVGNTGNASGGAAHLHFEIHDASGTPVNPFPRLTIELTLQQKINDLATILTQTSDSAALAQLLVNNFRSTFISALAANIALPQQIIATLATALMPATGVSAGITRNLYKGISGNDVLTLQKLLNSLGYTVATSGAGSAGVETTYFGPATLAAVIAYQKAHSITPAVGYVGTITRASLATLQ